VSRRLAGAPRGALQSGCGARNDANLSFLAPRPRRPDEGVLPSSFDREARSLITVASYNIHGGIGVDRRRDIDRIAAVIAEMDPDVIGLQEVIRAEGPPAADQPAYLATTLGMTMVMGATRPLGTGSFGNTILTRLPLIASIPHDLSHGRFEPRGCLRADVSADRVTVHFFNCHLGRRFKERREQLTLLGDLLAFTDIQGPRVLVGDLNEWHRGPITRGLRRQFPSPVSRVCRTYPSSFPIFALDRIYWDVDLEGRGIRAHRSRLARVASDHLPVLARLAVRTADTDRAAAGAGRMG
jgi:endonuclease/exonuclease/phosphatase family metal-dependent hydrolase